MFRWIWSLFSRRISEYSLPEIEEPRPWHPTGDVDEWNYREYLRILPLFEAAYQDYEADPLVTFVRLYAPDPSKGTVPECLRGVHLITASKKDWINMKPRANCRILTASIRPFPSRTWYSQKIWKKKAF